MILSYVRNHDETEHLIICLTPADAGMILSHYGEIDLASIPEAKHLHGLRITLTGPAGADALLRNAVESRDAGLDVRFRGRPGVPDE